MSMGLCAKCQAADETWIRALHQSGDDVPLVFDGGCEPALSGNVADELLDSPRQPDLCSVRA